MKRVTEKTLETIAAMLGTAREIVAELESGETVETQSDGEFAIARARTLARTLMLPDTNRGKL